MAARLTVIVPTYNGSRFLRSSLDSLAMQTEAPEIIVVDDGSSDDSAAIAEAHPAVTRVVRQVNRGVATARNHGLALATTTYVAFMDQDDLWHQDRSSILLDLASSSRAAGVATTEQVFARASDKEKMLSAGDPRVDWPTHWIEDDHEADLVTTELDSSQGTDTVTVQRLMQGAAFVTTAVMYEREAAIAAGGCAPFVRAADDHVLNVNIANIFGPIQRARVPALFYRVHAEATSNSSPMVAPLLTLQLALRYGRALPNVVEPGPNLQHLLSQVADQPGLSRGEQLSLLMLNAPREERWRWIARWLRRVTKQELTRNRPKLDN